MYNIYMAEIYIAESIEDEVSLLKGVLERLDRNKR